MDGAYGLGWDVKQRPVLVADDLGEGQSVAGGTVDEHDPKTVQRWLEPWMQKLGVSVIVTDDLPMYKGVARNLNLEHQICQFHTQRWVGRTLKELENPLPQEWQRVLAEIKEWMEDLSSEEYQCLYALWKQVKALGGDIPANNYTEQVIGRMKMRTRTVQGYKSWLGTQTGLMLAGTRDA